MPFWLPALSVIVAIALASDRGGIAFPQPPSGRRLWTAGILLFGALAIAATVWLGRRKEEDALTLDRNERGASSPSRRRQMGRASPVSPFG